MAKKKSGQKGDSWKESVFSKIKKKKINQSIAVGNLAIKFITTSLLSPMENPNLKMWTINRTALSGNHKSS